MTLTNEQKKQIEDKAREILKIMGDNFTGSVEFNCISGRNEVKYNVKEYGAAK